MKAQFALVLLAVLSIANFAEGKERLLKPVDSEKTFNELKPTAQVVEKGMGGYLKIAQGDVICYRWPNYRAESVVPFNYACTVYEQDEVAPAYAQPSAARSSRSAH